MHTTKYFLLAFPDAPLSFFQFLPRVASSLLTRGYSDFTPSGYLYLQSPFYFSHFLPFACHCERSAAISPSPHHPFTPSLRQPISQTISHIGRNSTSSFRRIFRELLICNSTVRFEIFSLSEIS